MFTQSSRLLLLRRPQGLLYRLVGRAESPVPEGKIERTITAKQAHTEVLRVHNWLHRPQRFKVIIARQGGDP